jgi:hypothetical protein
MNMHHRAQAVEPERMWRRLSLTGYRSLEVPGPGAVAHMSLHQKPTMSKSHPTNEADNNGSPIYTGGPVVRSVLATEANRDSRNRQRRVGEGPYMDGLDSGQRLFAILFRRPVQGPSMR